MIALCSQISGFEAMALMTRAAIASLSCRSV